MYKALQNNKDEESKEILNKVVDKGFGQFPLVP